MKALVFLDLILDKSLIFVLNQQVEAPVAEVAPAAAVTPAAAVSPIAPATDLTPAADDDSVFMQPGEEPKPEPAKSPAPASASVSGRETPADFEHTKPVTPDFTNIPASQVIFKNKYFQKRTALNYFCNFRRKLVKKEK